jgi:hypothetical protein
MTDHPPDPATDHGPAVLDRLRDTLTRYVVLPSPEATDAVTLWIAASHVQPAWAHAPRLVIRAPEKRCGKSRLLDVVEGTCHQPLITVNASTAAVYRSLGSADPPTLLVDEADTIFGGKQAEANEELRGLLNAGHQRNRPTIRWNSAQNRIETIPTFAMAALAGIGAMPDTIEDRAVVIRMRRRAPGESVAPYRHRRDGPALRRLAADLNRWLRANTVRLEHAEPAMPLEDRAADTWEPLIAVADLAGADWPDRARHAAGLLTAERDGDGVSSDRVRLLIDCRTAFGAFDAIPTAALLAALKADPEAPWDEYGGQAAGGLTAMRLGAMLRDYGIRSDTIRSHHPPARPRATTGPRSPTRGPATARPTRTRPPSRTSRTSRTRPAQTRYGLPTWYGSSRTKPPSAMRCPRPRPRPRTPPPAEPRPPPLVRLVRLKPYQPPSRTAPDLHWYGWYGWYGSLTPTPPRPARRPADFPSARSTHTEIPACHRSWLYGPHSGPPGRHHRPCRRTPVRRAPTRERRPRWPTRRSTGSPKRWPYSA